jgi:hypothetical protein
MREFAIKAMLVVVLPILWVWSWVCGDDVAETNALLWSIWEPNDEPS